MKLFGKALFDFKKEPEPMYDFAQHGLLNSNNYYGLEAYAVQSTSPEDAAKALEERKAKEAARLKPKGLYELKSLNANDFAIKTDPAYLKEEISAIKDKLSFIGEEKKPKKRRGDNYDEITMNYPGMSGGVKFGRLELKSILERLENRARIKEFTTVLEKYPHTTSELISAVTTEHNNLRCQRAEEFIPDFPKDAIAAMKEYNQMCIALCNKLSVYYVIADHTDFEVKNKRRDPILLAQSPFGHFWQILGAWDEEMVYLADL